MAENVFAVTASTRNDPPRAVELDEEVWRSEHRAEPATESTKKRIVHLSNGPVVPSCEARIAGPDGASLPSGHAGRVLIRSTFLFTGYFRRDDLNASLFGADGFYDTGDVGWMDAGGHLYVTGRMKDLVIVGGKNVYPQDIEQIANEVEGVHPGRVVCFGATLRGLGTEGPVLLAESDLPEGSWRELAQKIAQSVPPLLDLDLADVKVVAQGSLRKSTSGKLARSGNREWYLAGRFGAVPRHIEKE